MRDIQILCDNNNSDNLLTAKKKKLRFGLFILCSKIKNAWTCQMKILPSNVTSETVVQSVLICYFYHTQLAQILVSIYRIRTVCVTTKKKITPYTRGDDRYPDTR